ncbi:unnamed protein product [Lactuca saligna]|uniref:Uncharacterized protein n=1 Tax=Lactuca saligna TaxID=75948 RepID=A0AA35VS62_LACSI|nr:unnamed protein product [Lactuca saligna]
MLMDEKDGIDSDGEGFEAVTPEHNPKISEEHDGMHILATDEHTHVLEDDDGELEMEDVAPSRESDIAAPTVYLFGLLHENMQFLHIMFKTCRDRLMRTESSLNEKECRNTTLRDKDST